jgi:glycosyltransferase involved in cell wall biosynthesis
MYNCSLVIPVYNSAGCLAELVQRLESALPAWCGDFEIILVNDGSRDQSWAVIQGLAKEHPRVRGVNLMRNFGQHNALLCGVRLARFEVTITMDDDLQHPPEEIGKLLARLDAGCDVVYGIPSQLPHSLWRNATSRLSKWVMEKLTGNRTIRDTNSFRAFRTDLRNAFSAYNNPAVILDVLLSWGTTRFAAEKVAQSPRKTGSSNYNFLSLATHAIYNLIGFSTVPLRFASLTGFLFTLFGFGILIYVITIYFTLGSMPGFPFLASLIAIFSGVQLFTLGIIGEYLARMYDRTMDRPAYVVAATVGNGEQ